MLNAEVKVEGNILTITVDLKQRHGKSSTGKNMIIAKTEGPETLPGGEKINLTVFAKE